MATQGLLATGTDGRTRTDANPLLFDTGAASLREAAAARVAAHRNRRAGAQASEAARDEALRMERAQRERDARRGVSLVRDTVRARYAQTQSYRDFLAAEAERALQQARAEAEIAARNADAIAEAQMQLLEELRESESAGERVSESASQQVREVAWRADEVFEWEQRPVESTQTHWSHAEREAKARAAESGDLFAEPEVQEFASAAVKEITTGGLTVRLYDDFAALPPSPVIASARRFAQEMGQSEHEELEELEQEIAFRRAPDFADHVIETQPLPANLIEFPRELVASRKARPRLAEGPLRDELPAEPQLRIFEVDAEQISTAPAAQEETVTAAPVWQGMLLDAAPTAAVIAGREAARAAHLVDPAPISRRLMAAAVDACLIGVAVVGFATVVAWISGPRLQAMSRPSMGAAVVFTLAVAALLYQVLFFSLNESTPGMRYARIALCTFAEQSPTRRAMRRRILAALLAACPLGLGLLWAWMDDDRLAWHDRISRIYQRCY